ncbi:MAG: tetratricopeptide repeat protein, partial [Bdellovibrionales bacterium]
DVDDESTFLGHMLIQSGYLATDDLQEVLKDKSPRKIGQKLIDSCKLSPHAFDLILSEQMNVRLTRTIVEGKVKVNFVATEVEPVVSAIDSEALLRYLHDWVASKLPMAWLESLYLMWSGQKILKSSSWKADHPVFSTSFVKRLDRFPSRFENPITLNELLSIEGYDAISVHKAMHLMLLKGLIIFSSEKTSFDATSQRQHLKKIQGQIEGKSSQEVLELFQELLRGKPDNTWIDEFMKFVGPAPQDPEVLKMWTSIRDRFDKAIRVQWEQSNEEVTQIKFKEKGELRLSGLQKLDEVKAQLQLNQFQKASDIFNKIKYAEELPGGRTYRVWIQLGTLDPQNRLAQLKDIELELMQIPPDERYDALYLFVVGFYQKAKGDLIAARKSFEKSLAINPSFIIAKRELAIMDNVVKKPDQDIFNMDLKDVIGGFFKKNKAG